MQIDFHYYATYCAAYIAGYSHEESLEICYSAQFVDCCTRTFLSKLKAPLYAATTQLQSELIDARTDKIGLQDITRIWSSFHFLPYDLYAERKKCSKQYLNKYRLICNTNSDLLIETVKLAKGRSLQAVGVAMHILADTWAHRYFAGTPSLVINNTNYHFYEILSDGDKIIERPVVFRHSPGAPDDVIEGRYSASIYDSSENSIMNLGHGRAGHLPDYSFMRYKYLPAWGDYEEIVKDNPSDYMNAFCQMISAMRYLRGVNESFEKFHYEKGIISPIRRDILDILLKRQPDASADWKKLGEKLSGAEIEEFHIDKYTEEYKKAPKSDKDGTFLGKFILAALAQKSMVTHNIFRSGNMLAGISVDFSEKGFQGIADYFRLVEEMKKERNDEQI